MEKVVGLGIIGCGARIRTVVEKLIEKAGAQIKVVAVFDPDQRSIEAARACFGAEITVHASFDDLVNDSRVAWVFIGSMNCDHAEHAICALNAGKDVFCEKPLATDLDDCFAVREAIRRTKRTFSFGLVLRYSPHYQKIHELVRGGAIGELVSFEFNETLNFNHGGYIFGNWRRSRALAGTHILEKCCHDLDLANWITNSRPRRVASFGGIGFFNSKNEQLVNALGKDSEGRSAYSVWTDHRSVDPFSPGADIVDHQVVILEYESGVKASFHTNCNTSISERRFYLCGTSGTLRADVLSGTIEIEKIGHNSERETIRFEAKENHAGGDDVLAQDLLKTILKRTPPLATVNDGINAFIVAHAIDQSLDTGTVIDLSELWVANSGNREVVPKGCTVRTEELTYSS